MKKEKAGWKTVLLYVLGVIFAATFVYGVVYSVMNVMSTVSQYTALGQDIPASYTVNAIVSGILQLALPSLFFCAASFALGSLLKGKDVKAEDEVVKVEETIDVIEKKDEEADDAEKSDDAADTEATVKEDDDAQEADAKPADEAEEVEEEKSDEASEESESEASEDGKKDTEDK